MPQSHLISVIVPVYNAEKYLSQCLENLIFQTYKNLEIIIVDDGSTDGSHLVYEKYAEQDTRIKVIKQDNKGQSVARNVGIKNATGEYIHFMDNDDYIDLDYYEKMLKAAVDTQTDMAVSGFRCFVDGNDCSWSGINFSQNVVLTNTNDKLYITCGLKNPDVWKYLFRTKFIKDRNLSFEEGRYRYGEEAIFSVSALYYSNKIVLVPKVLYYYRYRRAGSIVTLPDDSQEAKQRDSDYIYSLNKVKEFLENHNLKYEVDNPNKNYVMSKYKLFSKLSLFRKKVYKNKIKYYILGGKVCILTVNTSEGSDK